MSTFYWSDFGCQILSRRRAFPFEQSCLEQYCLHDIEDRLRVLRGTTVPSAWKAAMLPDSPADASATLICGSPGCGKTMLGVEFLVNGARMYSEPRVFVAFEETQAELTENAASLKFDLDQLCREGLLAIDHVRVHPNEIAETGDYALAGLFIRLKHAIEPAGAKRLVLATLEPLFSGFSNSALLRAGFGGWFNS